MEPPRAKIEPKITDIFGKKLTDNYFWLRDKESPEVFKYLEDENAYTEYMMQDTREGQERLFDEMKSRINETDQSIKVPRGDYLYYNRTEEGLQHAILCREKDGVEQILINPNEIKKEGYIQIYDYAVNPTQNLIAYSIDETGDEIFTIYIKDLNTDKIIEKMDDVYYYVYWADENSIFYAKMDEIKRPYQIYLHKIGDDRDKLIFQEDDEERFIGLSKDLDEKFFYIYSDTLTSSEVWIVDLQTLSKKLFLERREDHEYSITHHEGFFYILTNDGATNFQLFRCPVNSIEKDSWELIIAHDPDVKLNYMSIYKDFFVLNKRSGGLVSMEVIDAKDLNLRYVIPMPEEIYSVEHRDQFNMEYDTEVYRFYYSSLISPPSSFEFNIKEKKLTLLKQEIIHNHNPEEYEVKREFAKAEDGKLIPVSIVHRKGLTDAPAQLYAYGSYGYSIDAGFRPSRLCFLERGMIYAIAHIRGSSYLGRQWYEDGKLLNKKNTFTDFIAVAEHLIDRGYTSNDKLSIMGGSAGGLLMGVVTNMRPDLFKVVTAQVPFVDVINTMLDASIPLTTHEYVEWGNPQNPEYFEYMYDYSPYDQIEEKNYPIMLVTAGLNDPRVQYWEPAKWVAKLRAMKTDENLLLLKTNMGAGHQGASGRYEYLKEIAFEYAFIFKALNIDF
ncbi:MAG: S9 family peptidase [Candidatus Heimdallarchaeota archaeon]|nr:S9 family peptidase [Candidatus Heimdallarchaeota archaeon]